MAGENYSIGSTAFKGLLLVVLGCGLQAAAMPTVRISCPARKSAEPDCDLRWLVGFDLISVRHTALPSLQPVGEIVQTAPSRSGGNTTLYLDTAAGRVRAIMSGDPLSLQKDLQEPLRAYLATADAPAIELTMRPVRWVDPGGYAADRLVGKTHPVVWAANGLIVMGLLFWIWLPVQIVTLVSGRSRS